MKLPQLKLSTVALLLLVGSILMSGVLNNTLSVIAVGMAVVSWLAVAKAGPGSTALGLIAVCGWLFLAAVMATAFREKST